MYARGYVSEGAYQSQFATLDGGFAHLLPILSDLTWLVNL